MNVTVCSVLSLCSIAACGPHGALCISCTHHACLHAYMSYKPDAGQLHWKQTATQPAANNSSTNSGSSSSTALPPPPPPQPQQQEEVARMQQIIERDVQQLAQDVFQKGQVLAGGRCGTQQTWLCRFKQLLVLRMRRWCSMHGASA